MSLFDGMTQTRASSPSEQCGLAFPTSLTERYRPHSLTQFVGLDKVKKILTNFAAKPFPNAAFLFIGPSGVGKTSAGIALCEMLRGELHHVPSQQCNVGNVEDVVRQCHYVPKNGTFHVVLVDEADQMSKAAQLALLSKLDATAFPPSTVFVFTCNSTDVLEPRFLSRCMELQFQSHGIASETAKLLEFIWITEAGESAEKPNFLRIVQSSKNNVRDAVNSLQVELLSV
jgi:replication-associated recombination protein RarA